MAVKILIFQYRAADKPSTQRLILVFKSRFISSSGFQDALRNTASQCLKFFIFDLDL